MRIQIRTSMKEGEPILEYAFDIETEEVTASEIAMALAKLEEIKLQLLDMWSKTENLFEYEEGEEDEE